MACQYRALNNQLAFRRNNLNGFSIVEAIISSFILVTAVTISLSLFTFSYRNAGQVETNQNEKNAVEADAMTILRINDQFSCSTATSSSTCGISSNSGTYPDENQYIPNSYTETPGTQTWLTAACGGGLGDELASYINNYPKTNLTALSIDRSASALGSSSSPHLYQVIWTKSGATLKQMILYPTVAAWCP